MSEWKLAGVARECRFLSVEFKGDPRLTLGDFHQPPNLHILFELSMEEIRGAKSHLNQQNVDFCLMVGHIKVDTVHKTSSPTSLPVDGAGS